MLGARKVWEQAVHPGQMALVPGSKSKKKPGAGQAGEAHTRLLGGCESEHRKRKAGGSRAREASLLALHRKPLATGQVLGCSHGIHLLGWVTRSVH